MKHLTKVFMVLALALAFVSTAYADDVAEPPVCDQESEEGAENCNSLKAMWMD